MADRNTTSSLPPRVLLIMIVERLIKIHRYPIYLHYSLLQMCVELKFPRKLSRFLLKIYQFFIFTHAFFRVSRGRNDSNLNFPENNARRHWSRLKRPTIKQIALWQYADDDIITEIRSTLDFMACFSARFMLSELVGTENSTELHCFNFICCFKNTIWIAKN